MVVDSNLDRPWSQYFCCVVAANREFAQKYPVATKRALRAILKGTDVCASEPDRASRYLVDSGRTPRYDLMRQMLKEIRYDRWRTYDPEDTVRFFALRLREAGMIRSTPQKIIATGHRLAIPERAEEGAEGVMERRRDPEGSVRGRRRKCHRRTSRLRGGAAAGDAAPADDGREDRPLHAGPAVSSRKTCWRAEGFTDVQYVHT